MVRLTLRENTQVVTSHLHMSHTHMVTLRENTQTVTSHLHLSKMK